MNKIIVIVAARYYLHLGVTINVANGNRIGVCVNSPPPWPDAFQRATRAVIGGYSNDGARDSAQLLVWEYS